MNRRSLLFATVALVAACSRETQQESLGFTSIDVPGNVQIETAGVRIEVEDSVRYRFHSVSRSPGETSSEATLNGHPFGLREGVFFIGEDEFGPAPAGALVRVSTEGVFVDGEKRGDVPAPVSPAGG